MRNNLINLTILLLLVFGLTKNFQACGMEKQIDSLKTVCLTEKDELKLTDNFNRLAVLYAYSNVDSMLHYSEKALVLAQKNNYKKGIGNALFYLSYGYDQTGDWNDAIVNLEKAIVIFEEIKDTTSLIACYLNTGVLHSYGAQQVKALEYIIKAKNLTETTDEKFALSEALTNIGTFYEYLKEYRSAFHYYSEALQLDEEAKNTENISMSNIALGFVNIKLKRLDEAYENLKTAEELLPQIKDLHRETEVLILFAHYYLEVDLLDEAESTINKVHKLIEEQKFERLEAEAEYLTGKLYLKRNNYKQALERFDVAISESKKLDRYDLLSDIYTDKTQAYAKSGQYEKAYQTQQQQNELNTIIQPNRIAQVLGEFEVQEQLKEQRRQQQLQQELLDEKNRSSKYRERVRLQITIFSFSLLIILIIILGYYAILRRKHAKILKENYNTINKQKLQLEENLKKLEEDEQKLKKLNATKDKFFSIIAHDLKNPFNVMIGISDLMRSSSKLKNGDEFDTMIEGMFQAATSGYSLLENLLEWSRTQTDSIQFNPEYFPIQKIFSANKSLYKEAIKSKNIQLSIPSVKEKVYADYNMVNFIFRNLLNNAIKFSYEGGKIDITTEIREDVLVCTIKDYGIGMSQDTVNKLFKIEHSVQYDGTANEKGTGLGLILCKEFIEKNCGSCGSINVQSEPGKGSTFSFGLPLTDQKKN